MFSRHSAEVAVPILGGYTLFWFAFNVRSPTLAGIGHKVDLSYGVYLLCLACGEFIDLAESRYLAVAGFHRNYCNRRPSGIWQLVAGGEAVLEPKGGVRADGACERSIATSPRGEVSKRRRSTLASCIT
jgi:hypothetical protein